VGYLGWSDWDSATEGGVVRRVLVTGSRDWKDLRAVHDAIWRQYVDNLDTAMGFTVVHGDCPTGADAFASSYCLMSSAPIIEEKHPADWDTHGKAAGPLRNQEMVDLGADVCLAFPLPESRGTRDCMRRAKAAGIPVVVVEVAS
jgi:hypothetical protein